MANQAIVLPNFPVKNGNTSSDAKNETDDPEQWSFRRRHPHRSSTSSVDRCSSSQLSIDGQFRRSSSVSFSAGLTNGISMASATIKPSLKDVSDSKSQKSTLVPSASKKASKFPEYKEKRAISLKSRSVGSSSRWSGMHKGIKKRKVIYIMSRKLRDRNKQRTAMEANYLHDEDSSSEENSREDVDHMIQNFWHFGFNSAYQSKGKIRLNTSLSLKYQPKLFRDISGHEMTVKALHNAVEKKKIAPLYLFHGPSGTGKTSTAKIFAMALNCASTSPTRPCWSCRGCSRSLYIMELCSGSRMAGFERIKTLFHSTSLTWSVPGFKVLIIEECHVFTAEAWDELLGMVEGPYSSMVIFVLITTDANSVPRKISSRCQKFCFPKLMDKDIALKLTKIGAREDIRIEREALKLIIVKSEGSLREAENILDQLVLLGSTLNSSIVQQLVGLVPHSKLINLLATAISGDTINTIKLAKGLIATGVEPQALASQLASLITDILSEAAATVNSPSSLESSKDQRLLRSTSITTTQLQRLCYALKMLVEAEKQLRSLTDQTSRICAALLEISSAYVCNRTSTGDNRNAESETGDIREQQLSHRSSRIYEILDMDKIEAKATVRITNRTNSKAKEVEKEPNLAHPSDMEKIWQNILDRIENRHLTEFLCHQGKLASLSLMRANAIVHLMFKRPEDKKAAQTSEENISKALENAIGCPVTVNMSLEPVASGIIEEDSIPIKGQQMDPKQQKRTCLTEAATRRLTSEESSSSQSENHRPMKLKDSSFSPGQNRSASEDKESWSPEAIPFLGLWTAKNQVDTSEDPERETLTREQTLAERGHLKSSSSLKHKWLSLSSILESDASVEPYSQDILFEKANGGREIKVRKIPKFHKGHSKPTEDFQFPDSASQPQLKRSWSWTNGLCRKKTDV